LPAGKVGAAVGFDIRRETYQFDDGTGNQPGLNGVSSTPSLPSVGRNIKAVFGELQIPILKNLEAQLAVRRDQYSDFGGTTNPKAGIRWQPVKEVAFRSSYSTGFHAPDFDALYGGSSTNQFNSDINDPVLCPTGKEARGCGIRPDIITTSNAKLQAEKSKQYTFGVILAPAPWITSTIDYWHIDLDNRISTLSGQTLIKNYTQYSQYVVRGTPPAGSTVGDILSVNAPYFNLAGDKADGIDINVTMNFKTDVGQWTAVLDGSYLNSYKSRYSKDDPWVERVNQFGDAAFGWDLKLRWKHNLSLTWAQGPWGVTAVQNFSNGYQAETDGFGSGFTPAGAPSKIGSYTVYNLSTSYTGFKNLTLTVGIKNLFDTKPPFSAHNVDNVSGAGWDARVADPRMRALNLRANYKFW
jgi:iron complex outermembrane receptor protein